MPNTIDIADRRELFVDHFLIDHMDNVALRLATPERREVVLDLNQPWEGPSGYYYVALRDGEQVRLYYRADIKVVGGDESDDQLTGVAISDDGIHFTRPSLGLYEHDGSRDNNIVWKGVTAHNFAPFIDGNPECKPEQRYKAVGGVSEQLHAFSSPDGCRWQRMQDEPTDMKGAFDSLNVAFWDSVTGCYRAFVRGWQKRTGDEHSDGVRMIQSCTSDDLLHWSEPTPNEYAADAPREHFYTNSTQRCPGAEHVFVSFPKRFFRERKKIDEHEHPGVSDAAFMTSRDGVRWDRTFTEAWMRPGLDPRNWTQRNNGPAWGIIETADDEWSMYIGEHYCWDTNRLRRLVLRPHGFASVHAGRPGGEFVTPPLTFSGHHLMLNYATSAAGSVRAEIQDAAGKPVPGFALDDMEHLYGDELDTPVTWRNGGDLSKLIGQPVRLRFTMMDADLYAMRTGPQVATRGY